MRNDELPERVEENRNGGQTSEAAYELPEEAKRCIARLILSRRLQLLRQESGQKDSPLQEGQET